MSAFIRFFSISFLAGGIALAQVASGTITGTVQDSSGAVLQGAKVTIVQQATSETRGVVTNDRGEFNAPNLHVGQYSVTVTMAALRLRSRAA